MQLYEKLPTLLMNKNVYQMVTLDVKWDPKWQMSPLILTQLNVYLQMIAASEMVCWTTNIFETFFWKIEMAFRAHWSKSKSKHVQKILDFDWPNWGFWPYS